MRKNETLILLTAATLNGICINQFGFVATADIMVNSLLMILLFWLFANIIRAIKEFAEGEPR